MHRLDAPLRSYYLTCVLIKAFLPVGNVISFISKAHYLRSLVLGLVVNRGQGAQGSSGSALISKLNILMCNYKQRLNVGRYQ